MVSMLLWDDAWKEYYKSGYTIRGHERADLFGYFSKTEMCEDVYVFSDEFFDQEWKRIQSEESEPSLLVCIRIPGQYRVLAGAELKDHVEEKGIPTVEDSHVLYAAEDTKVEKKSESIMYITVSIFLIFTLYISSIFVIGMKTLAEIPAY